MDAAFSFTVDRVNSLPSEDPRQEVSLERKPGTYFGVDLSSAGKATRHGTARQIMGFYHGVLPMGKPMGKPGENQLALQPKKIGLSSLETLYIL